MIGRFYKDKKVLITGVTGFKGSWLATWLILLKAKVYGIGYQPNKNKKSEKISTKLRVPTPQWSCNRTFKEPQGVIFGTFGGGSGLILCCCLFFMLCFVFFGAPGPT